MNPALQSASLANLSIPFRSLHRGALLLLSAALLLTGCRSTPPTASLQRFQFAHPAMGTLFTTTLYATNEDVAWAAADAAFHRVEALEDITSDYQADSELMRLRDQPAGKPVPVSADLFDILQRAQKLSELSGGAFDVTVGPYVRLWRFARKRKVLPTQAQLAEARAAVGYRKLHLDPRARTVTLLAPNMRLDLGGIAKGYAADQALKLLKSKGIDRALVAASGDIAIGNPPPGRRGWKIGITAIDASTYRTAPDASANESAKGAAPTPLLLLSNVGISTSGDTEQFIEIGGVRYSHILDPTTGLGLTHRIQATVIAPNATTSDPMATTVCVLGVKRGLALVNSLPRTAALILTKEDGRTRSFPSRRFSHIPSVRP